MPSPSTLATLLAAASTVSAHGWIDSWLISGETYVGFNPTNAPWVPDQGTIGWPAWNTDTGPVYSNNLTSPDIICQINATNPKLYAAPVAAGATVQVHWTMPWPDSHHGPIISYLAACDGDCTTVDKTKLKWFKIAEMGQLTLGAGGGEPGFWASDQLQLDDGVWSVTIPKSIKAGNYVLRNEILALHGAYAVGAAQFYPQCANLRITGEGSAVPKGVVGTELYQEEHPGVLYNIYNDESKPVYQIPGPPLCKWLFLPYFLFSRSILESVLTARKTPSKIRDESGFQLPLLGFTVEQRGWNTTCLILRSCSAIISTLCQ